jgi:hypothetical protein
LLIIRVFVKIVSKVLTGFIKSQPRFGIKTGSGKPVAAKSDIGGERQPSDALRNARRILSCGAEDVSGMDAALEGAQAAAVRRVLTALAERRQAVRPCVGGRKGGRGEYRIRKWAVKLHLRTIRSQSRIKKLRLETCQS